MKVRIQCCNGIMCASGGGGRYLERIFEKHLTDAGVIESVELISPGCMGSCAEGPCVRINGQKFFHVTPDDVPALIAGEVIPLLKE